MATLKCLEAVRRKKSGKKNLFFFPNGFQGRSQYHKVSLDYSAKIIQLRQLHESSKGRKGKTETAHDDCLIR